MKLAEAKEARELEMAEAKEARENEKVLKEREMAEAKEARERETVLKEREMAEAKEAHECELQKLQIQQSIEVVVLLFYVHGKHLRSCRDGQLT